MKTLTTHIALLSLLVVTIVSCDKVEQPLKPVIDIDTTLFTDGNWADYPMPTFPTNTNMNRNVLIEDYTGHKCPNCPAAADVAAGIETANPERVFVVSIHAGAGGDNSFQALNANCGDLVANPHNEFCYDFSTNEGTEYGIKFQSYGFVGNPFGNINRITFSDAMFQFHTSWVAKTDEVLTENDLKANLQAISNYYTVSNGVYLHVETQFLEDLTGNYSIVTYVVDNEIIEWQDNAGTYDEHYHHHNVLLGTIDGLTWGQSLATNPKAGDIFQTDYAYELPTGLNNDSIHFLSYVYDVDSYEILQVIKHEF